MSLPHTSPPAILSLDIGDAEALYRAYMPFLKSGGLFVPGAPMRQLGDKVVLRLILGQDSEPLSVTGKVAWLTPAAAQGNRSAGVGVQFDDSPQADAARGKIESILGSLLHAQRPTQTM